MNDNYNSYELIGSYFTAGESTPMYFAMKQADGSWAVNPKPYDTLTKGKTFPMQISQVFDVNGKEYFITSPHHNAKLNKEVSTAFVRGDNTVGSIAKDLIHTPGSSYYVPKEDSFFVAFGKQLKWLLIFAVSASVARAFFLSKRKS